MIPLVLWAKQHLPRRVRAALRRLIYLPVDVWDAVSGKRQPLRPPRGLLSVEGDYEAIGVEFTRYLIEYCALRADACVLDIGCGVGRMAVPLTRVLSRSGAYHGTDIIPEAIRWCRRAISPRFPNFSFHLADVYNQNYNPAGRQAPATYTFQFADESFDLVFLASVFTHMDRESIANYLREITRMLRPQGTCLATYFLLNEEVLAHKSAWSKQFPYGSGSSLIADTRVPEIAVAHPESDIRSLVEQAGLAVREPVLWGSWCGRHDYLSYQDIVIADKRP